MSDVSQFCIILPVSKGVITTLTLPLEVAKSPENYSIALTEYNILSGKDAQKQPLAVLCSAISSSTYLHRMWLPVIGLIHFSSSAPRIRTIERISTPSRHPIHNTEDVRMEFITNARSLDRMQSNSNDKTAEIEKISGYIVITFFKAR